jgi:hypothetical protein
MEARRPAIDMTGRPPATCLLGHLHLFELHGRAYQVFHAGERIGWVSLSRVDGTWAVNLCVICGCDLRTVEG